MPSHCLLWWANNALVLACSAWIPMTDLHRPGLGGWWWWLLSKPYTNKWTKKTKTKRNNQNHWVHEGGGRECMNITIHFQWHYWTNQPNNNNSRMKTNHTKHSSFKQREYIPFFPISFNPIAIFDSIPPKSSKAKLDHAFGQVEKIESYSLKMNQSPRLNFNSKTNGTWVETKLEFTFCISTKVCVCVCVDQVACLGTKCTLTSTLARRAHTAMPKTPDSTLGEGRATWKLFRQRNENSSIHPPGLKRKIFSFLDDFKQKHFVQVGAWKATNIAGALENRYLDSRTFKD